MSFNLTHLFLAGLGYLLLLFAIAYFGERGYFPKRLVRHPLTYVLSLGVFGGTTFIYNTVDTAYTYGYGYLALYTGVGGTFLFAPLLLSPLLRICRLYQLSSLADLLTFRFRSQWAGSAVTLFMLLAMMPLLALQMQAVSDTVHVLTSSPTQIFTPAHRADNLALMFCIIISVFAILFGSKHRHHDGLVAAIAFESLVKLGIFLGLGVFAVYGVFNGFPAMDQWLQANPSALEALRSPIRQDSARALMLIFFSVTICTPHMFHMLFAENPSHKALQQASWGFSIYLLLLSLPVLPILWAGLKLNTSLPPEYFTLALGIEQHSPAIALLVYIGSLSAASGAIIVITLAMASMCLNHLILPFYQPDTDRDIYRWLLWTRRVLIVAIILCGYFFYQSISGREELSDLGMAAFVATLQFLPGVLAVLYWPRANRIGFLGGLLAGFIVWFVLLLLPLISDFSADMLIAELLPLENARDVWVAAALLSLALNTLVFATLSLLAPTTDEERAAAEVCALDDLNRPKRLTLKIRSIAEIYARLATTVLGEAGAKREVQRALADLKLNQNENRPYALRRLRDRIETNLSGLMGPAVAREIVNRTLPYEQSGGLTEDINLIEARLERYKYHLTGLAADLDSLRRHHRQTLQDLPIGLCSLGPDREILMWNRAMEDLTGVTYREVLGSHVSNLPQPWRQLLDDFFHSPDASLHKQRIEFDGKPRWIGLLKASTQKAGENTGADAGDDTNQDGQVIVMEDMTEIQLLEHELVHSERLASIGRLAAGVAHEIGNPVTGIACLAQNLKYDTENPESLETAEQILTQTDRISRIVQTLVNFAHSGSGHTNPEPSSIARSVDEAIHLLGLNKDARPVQFINRCAPDIYVVADDQRLLQVFVNLLSNARDASAANAPIEIGCELVEQTAHIAVTDRGSGIRKEHLDQVFEPFFTTKEPGEGTGLGLAMVYGIVEDLHGHIDIESPVPEQRCGTRIHIWLPAGNPADYGLARVVK